MAIMKEVGVKAKIFFHEGANKSNWFMPLTYDGKAEVEQYGDIVPKK